VSRAPGLLDLRILLHSFNPYSLKMCTIRTLEVFLCERWKSIYVTLYNS
jgi:hypothetical protein